jgi:hypothetical protein
MGKDRDVRDRGNGMMGMAQVRQFCVVSKPIPSRCGFLTIPFCNNRHLPVLGQATRRVMYPA